MLDELVFQHRSALLALALDAPTPRTEELPLPRARRGGAAPVGDPRPRQAGARPYRGPQRAPGDRPLRARNPLYLANGAITVGLGLLAAGPLGAAAPLVGVALVYGLAVRHEEVALAALLGADDAAYMARVPRWLSRLRPHRRPSSARAVGLDPGRQA